MNIRMPRDKKDIKEIAKICRCFRVERGYLQREIAFDTDYSVEAVSSFERGRSNNAVILFWYIEHGLDREHIRHYNSICGGVK